VEVAVGKPKQLGPASTLTTKFNLASMLHEMGEWNEARPLFEEVVAGFTEQLEPAHPLTQQALRALSLLHDRRMTPL
jgi:hypothetical protein